MSWRRRLRSLFEKRKLEDQLGQELQFHIEMRTQEFIATGMTPQGMRASIRCRLPGTQFLHRVELIQDIAIKVLRDSRRTQREQPN